MMMGKQLLNLVDIAFLMSDHFKQERRGAVSRQEPGGPSDMLYQEFRK
jgi:hypothetical protein